jgi:hypothetical protein
MNIRQLRQQLAAGTVKVHVVTHAAVEAAKDGIEAAEISHALKEGEVIEDYNDRALLLDFIPGGQIPFHVVVEYTPGAPRAFVVTAYVPDSECWEKDWKTRKRQRRGGER